MILDPGPAEFEISAAEGWEILALDYTPPQTEMLAASGVATEGELSAGSKVGNRTVSGTFEYVGDGVDEEARHADMRAKLSTLEAKVGKLAREGGVWRRVLSDGSTIDFYIRQFNTTDFPTGEKLVFANAGEVSLAAVCAPYGVGEEQEIEVTLEHAGPVLVTEPFEVPGTAPALAAAVISAENDLWWLRPGIESRNLSEEPTAGCYYPATDLTPLGTATITSGVVRQGALTPTYQAMLSTVIAGVGPMTHVGVFEIYAVLNMPATNTGEVSVYLEWATGNRLRATANRTVAFPANHVREGQDVLVSLGEVRLPRPVHGEPEWEGRVVAASTVAGDDLDVAWLGLVPLTEGNATISDLARLDAPTSILLRDEFNHSAGNLHGKAIAAAGSIVGPLTAGTLANDASAGTVAWSGPAPDPWAGSVMAWSTANLGGSKVSQYLKATNFGFAIPSGVTIKGIVAEVKWSGSWVAPAQTAIRPVKGGTVQSAVNKASVGQALPDTGSSVGMVWQAFGGSADLWSTAWAYTDINSSGFGVVFQVTGNAAVASFAHVESVRITVTYETTGGETWSTTGDATDLAVETTGHTAQRAEVSDTSNVAGRYAIAGTSSLGPVVVGVGCKRTTMTIAGGERAWLGVLARYTDTSNWLFAGFDVDVSAASPTDRLCVYKRVAGTLTEVAAVPVPRVHSAFRSVWLHVDSAGRFFVWVAAQGATPSLAIAGSDDALATSGALGTGKTGFYDLKLGANACTRNYDNFVVWPPPASGLVEPGLGVEWAHDRVLRQAPDGGWGDVPDHRADFLRLPPSGVENRKTRLIVLPAKNDPAVAAYPDSGDLAVQQLTVIPRYLAVPDATA